MWVVKQVVYLKLFLPNYVFLPPKNRIQNLFHPLIHLMETSQKQTWKVSQKLKVYSQKPTILKENWGIWKLYN